MPSTSEGLEKIRKLSPMACGEYLLEITSADVSKSKAGNVVIVLGLESAQGSTKGKTVRAYITLSRKAAGHANSFWNAVGIRPKDIKAAGGVHVLVGQKVWALTGISERDGNRYTQIEEWICDQDTKTVGEQMELGSDKEVVYPTLPTPPQPRSTLPTPPTPSVEQIF